ncbi:MAG: magnesium chelatase, partial [Clostridia bacterium]|nr:magnesium chelatase [Clostridia bacterium]
HNVLTNSALEGNLLGTYCPISSDARGLLEKAFDNLGLSMRALNKILKVSRTIADLEGEAKIGLPHVAEAIQLRFFDRKV